MLPEIVPMQGPWRSQQFALSGNGMATTHCRGIIPGRIRLHLLLSIRGRMSRDAADVHRKSCTSRTNLVDARPRVSRSASRKRRCRNHRRPRSRPRPPPPWRRRSLPSPKKKPRGRPGSPVRLARAEADSVTALVKENKLAAELRQLHQWREAVGGSFKLAWQQARPHRATSGVTLDLGAAAEPRASSRTSVERLQHQQRAAAAEGEVERLRAAAARAPAAAAPPAAHGAALRPRAPARGPRDKAALCENSSRSSAASRPDAAAAGGGRQRPPRRRRRRRSRRRHGHRRYRRRIALAAGARRLQSALRLPRRRQRAPATAAAPRRPRDRVAVGRAADRAPLASGDNDDPPSSQRTPMANELGELFERFDAAALAGAALASGGAALARRVAALAGAALRSPSARSTSRFSAAIEPADPVTATGARAQARRARRAARRDRAAEARSAAREGGG